MFFGEFFDEEKPSEENKKESEKARHNRDVLLCLTAALGLVTAAVGAGFAVKKVIDEVV